MAAVHASARTRTLPIEIASMLARRITASTAAHITTVYASLRAQAAAVRIASVLAAVHTAGLASRITASAGNIALARPFIRASIHTPHWT